MTGTKSYVLCGAQAGRGPHALVSQFLRAEAPSQVGRLLHGLSTITMGTCVTCVVVLGPRPKPYLPKKMDSIFQPLIPGVTDLARVSGCCVKSGQNCPVNFAAAVLLLVYNTMPRLHFQKPGYRVQYNLTWYCLVHFRVHVQIIV